MAGALRSFSFALILLAILAGPTFAQATKGQDTTASDKPPENKPSQPPANKPDVPSNPPALNNDQIYSKSVAALTELFVVALLLESAFAVIFNWRVFLAYFSLRGVRTIVMISASWLIVYKFHLDVLANLIAAYQSPPTNPAPGPFSQFVTALILAGGSSGVNRIMTTLGFRSPSREEEVAPRPPVNKAWVAVRVDRKRARSEVFVRIKDVGSPGANSPSPIAGVVTFRRARLSGLLFRDTNRFPQNGGYTVSPNTLYSISVETKDENGQTMKGLDDQQYVFAAGAIVDFDVTL